MGCYEVIEQEPSSGVQKGTDIGQVVAHLPTPPPEQGHPLGIFLMGTTSVI